MGRRDSVHADRCGGQSGEIEEERTESLLGRQGERRHTVETLAVEGEVEVIVHDVVPAVAERRVERVSQTRRSRNGRLGDGGRHDHF